MGPGFESLRVYHIESISLIQLVLGFFVCRKSTLSLSAIFLINIIHQKRIFTWPIILKSSNLLPICKPFKQLLYEHLNEKLRWRHIASKFAWKKTQSQQLLSLNPIEIIQLIFLWHNFKLITKKCHKMINLWYN